MQKEIHSKKFVSLIIIVAFSGLAGFIGYGLGCSRSRVATVDQDISPSGEYVASVLQSYSSGIGNFDYWIEIEDRKGNQLLRLDAPKTSSQNYPDILVLWQNERRLNVYVADGFRRAPEFCDKTKAGFQIHWVTGPGSAVWDAYCVDREKQRSR